MGRMAESLRKWARRPESFWSFRPISSNSGFASQGRSRSQNCHAPYEKGLLAPKLDAHEFAREYSRRKIDIDAEGYEPIPEIRKWLEKYPVPERLAPEVTEIEMDGGSEIYTQLCPFWDGEDGAFDLNTITEAELRQFPNLKHITLMSSKPEQALPVLERCSIKVDLL